MKNNEIKLLIKSVEQNTLGHFTFLPKELKFDVYERTGIHIINCGLESSMFNIVYGAPNSLNIPNTISDIKEIFNGQPFAWWVPPSQRNVKLTQLLLDNGFIAETTEHAMICDLKDRVPLKMQTNLVVNPITETLLIKDFIKIFEQYDNAVNNFYGIMHSKHLQLQERFFVGYVKNKPVTIATLFYLNGSVGIFNLITQEEEQGKGYGSDMMRMLLLKAKEYGCKYATLSASSYSATRIYERLGFYVVGEFECFEYKNR